MKYKIGAFGSADGDIQEIFSKAHQVGEALGKKKVIVITGASTGLPNEIAVVAKQNGAELWGFSPGVNEEKQKELLPGADLTIYDKLVYIPQNYEFIDEKQVSLKYRNVSSTASCDAGIIISGRWGSMNEFTNLYDMGKVIGILTESGGIADELESLMKKISKPTKAKVIFNSSPKQLVDEVINELDNRR